MATSSTPEFDRLKTLADTIVHQQHWTVSTVLFLAVSLASEVNKFVSLSGVQKKQLVLAVVRTEFQEAVAASSALSGQSLVSQELRVSLNFLIEEALPVTLDTLVAVAHGKFDLKKVEQSCLRGCLACLPLLCATAAKEVPVIRPVADLIIRTLPTPPSSAATENPPSTGADKNTIPPNTTSAVSEGLREAEAPQPTPAH